MKTINQFTEVPSQCSNARPSKTAQLRASGKWIFAATFIVTSISALGAAQPIPGIDISAKKNPGGVKSSMFVGGGGGGLPIANNFFFPGFNSAARFAAPEQLFGEGALPGGAILSIQRFTEPDFGISLPSYAINAKILSLSVASETPLFIDATHSYDWSYLITSTSMGSMSVTNETALAGHISASSFAVSYHVEFTQVGGSGGPLAINGGDSFAFSGTPDWSNQFPDGSTPPGGTNFVLGSDGVTIAGATIASSSGIFSSNVQAVPEPAAVSLLAFGSLLALRRRR